MREIKHLIVHHSASDWGNVDIFREWHLERNFSDVGYHYVILNGTIGPSDDYNSEYDGAIEAGRPEEIAGAHCKGANQYSIGICLVGDFTKDEPSESQWNALVKKLVFLCKKYNLSEEDIYGHKEACEKLLGKAGSTQCPGNIVMDRVRADVHGLLSAEKPDPKKAGFSSEFIKALDDIGELELSEEDDKIQSAAAAAEIQTIMKEFDKFLLKIENLKLADEDIIRIKLEDTYRLFHHLMNLFTDHRVYVARTIMDQGENLQELRLKLLKRFKSE